MRDNKEEHYYNGRPISKKTYIKLWRLVRKFSTVNGLGSVRSNVVHYVISKGGY